MDLRKTKYPVVENVPLCRIYASAEGLLHVSTMLP
jgi:hypothetical protein